MIVYNLADNLLNSENILDESRLHSILEKKLKKSKLSLNNKTRNTSSNNIYDIDINGNSFVMKTLAKSSLTDIDKEITNMTKINNNTVAKPYILQCKYLIKTNDTIISIFEHDDSMVLKEVINRLHKMKDDNKKKKLQRYLIFMLLKSISDLHKANICHLQININNILVNINKKYNEDEVYTTEYPLNVKFINFNLHFNNIKTKYISTNNLDRLDPYINYGRDELISIDTAKKYDIWCISLIILKIILLPEEYFDFVKKLIINSYIDTDITIPIYFKVVYKNIVKYVLTELLKRKPAEFILNKIILDEKHD